MISLLDMNPDQPNSFYRVAVCAMILDESKQKFCIVYNEHEKIWELPGGGLDWSESAQETIQRELQEEMGLPTTWIAEYPVYFFTHQNKKGVWKVAAIYETEVEHMDFTPTPECRDIRFVDLHDLEGLEVFERVNMLASTFDATRHKKDN